MQGLEIYIIGHSKESFLILSLSRAAPSAWTLCLHSDNVPSFKAYLLQAALHHMLFLLFLNLQVLTQC